MISSAAAAINLGIDAVHGWHRLWSFLIVMGEPTLVELNGQVVFQLLATRSDEDRADAVTAARDQNGPQHALTYGVVNVFHVFLGRLPGALTAREETSLIAFDISITPHVGREHEDKGACVASHSGPCF